MQRHFLPLISTLNINLADVTPRQLISLMGDADMAAQKQDIPEQPLTQQRAELRQHLAQCSMQRNEQIYLLSEAVTLLEMLLMYVPTKSQHDEVSAHLANVYMQLYSITKQSPYLLIAGQILKPLSALHNIDILNALVRFDSMQQHPSLVRHWITRILTLPASKLDYATRRQFLNEPAVIAVQQQNWFLALTQLPLFQSEQMN